MKETAVYIHIPFCDHKCIYCDFYSIISYENVSTYLNSLKKEVEFYSSLYSEERKIISIYFGGGTPSFMFPQYISDIIEHVKKHFYVSEDAEITLETNPGTVEKQKLIEFRKIGINRISIGIQSFNENELKFLTRIHDAETATKTVNDATESGFDNISIDLIFNLPGQTKKIWITNLQKAVQLPIKHISAYSLILEKGTILNKMVLEGKIKMQNEDYDANLYKVTIEFLTERGFEQYEVSNFAKPGYECIHNNAYWQYKDYISFGTSAHSFVEGNRWWNYSSLKFYNASVEKKGNAVIGGEKLSPNDMLNEYVMLALRGNGLNIAEFKNLFGEIWLNKNERIFEELTAKKFISKTNEKLKLTAKGFPVCDEILTLFK